MLWVYAVWCPCFNIKNVKKIGNENLNHIKKPWSTRTSLWQWWPLYTLARAWNKFCNIFGMIQERDKKAVSSYLHMYELLPLIEEKSQIPLSTRNLWHPVLSLYQLLGIFSNWGVGGSMWGIQVLRSPNFFSRGMEADRNMKVVGGDVAVL